MSVVVRRPQLVRATALLVGCQVLAAGLGSAESTKPPASTPTLAARFLYASEATRKRLDLESFGGGVVIVEVYAGGPASQAGLRKDDVIAKVDDVAFKDGRDLIQELRKRRIGQKVSLNLWRQGSPLKVAVTLTDVSQLYERDCKAGTAKACNDLGILYGRGDGVQRDDVRAVGLHRQACEGGDAEACSYAGWMTETGLGTPKDEAQAAVLYLRSCQGGSPWGCGNLGRAHALGMSMPKDEARAADLYKQACDAGDPDACASRGWFYEKGIAVPADKSQAAISYKQGCDGGNAYGCGSLGVLLLEEQGLAQATQAAMLLRQACDWGHARSCTNLGSLSENGQGVPRDLAQARVLYKRGCDSADNLGCTNLKNADASSAQLVDEQSDVRKPAGISAPENVVPNRDYDQPPRMIKNARPQYPREAFDQKIEGTVELEILIDATGRVVHARVTKSIPLLDQAAIQCVYLWQFSPGVKHGRPVATRANAPVMFRIY